MITATTITAQDILDAPTLALPNAYRIGDACAVMMLRKLIEDRCGPKTWVLAQQNRWLNLLTKYAVDEQVRAWQWSVSAHPTEVAVPIDDVETYNLWILNDCFYRLGHRVDLAPRAARHYEIVFAPLTECDYSVERTMHPRFVEELAMHLGKIDAAVIVLVDNPNQHDWHWLRRCGATVTFAPLEEAIEIIGNCELFIGGDTGLTHIAGMFPNVQQIALHSRTDTERKIAHSRSEYNEQRGPIMELMAALGCPVEDCEYRSFPNKRPIAGAGDATGNGADARAILFDHNGMDGETPKRIVQVMGQM